MAAQGLGLTNLILSEALHSGEKRIFVELGAAASPFWMIFADRIERRDRKVGEKIAHEYINQVMIPQMAKVKHSLATLLAEDKALKILQNPTSLAENLMKQEVDLSNPFLSLINQVGQANFVNIPLFHLPGGTAMTPREFKNRKRAENREKQSSCLN